MCRSGEAGQIIESIWTPDFVLAEVCDVRVATFGLRRSAPVRSDFPSHPQKPQQSIFPRTSAMANIASMALRLYGCRKYVGIVFCRAWRTKEIRVAGRQFSFNKWGARKFEKLEKHLRNFTWIVKSGGCWLFTGYRGISTGGSGLYGGNMAGFKADDKAYLLQRVPTVYKLPTGTIHVIFIYWHRHENSGNDPCRPHLLTLTWGISTISPQSLPAC